MSNSFLDSTIFVYLVVPLLIFMARILDVSLQTIRIIAISRNIRWLAPLVGFFEVLIWLVAISQIMKNYAHILTYIAYAAGFATGTFIGMILTEKLSLGMALVRIISPYDTNELKASLRDKHYGFTVIPGQGSEGPVEVIFTVVRRQKLDFVLSEIQNKMPKAFYTVEDVSQARPLLYPLAMNKRT
jgi:uncharacterized protein YebE (UPF0316 family)